MSFPTFAPPRRVRLRPKIAPSSLRPWIPRLARTIAGPYLRLVGYRTMGFKRNAEATRLWTEFYEGKIRLIVAFRHPYGNDPQVLATSVVKGIATLGIPFIQFVHGAEVGW